MLQNERCEATSHTCTGPRLSRRCMVEASRSDGQAEGELEACEDAMWLVLAKLGVTEMNGVDKRHVNVGASKEPGVQSGCEEFGLIEKILFAA